MSVRRVLLGVLLGVAAAVTLAFLLLPILAIFVHTSPGRLLSQLSSPVVKDAFVAFQSMVVLYEEFQFDVSLAVDGSFDDMRQTCVLARQRLSVKNHCSRSRWTRRKTSDVSSWT